MTLEELEDQLPNGFHDSMVSRLSLDFVSRTAVLELSLWVGDLESDDESLREAHRNAAVTLRGLQFCAVDPPDPRYPYAAPEPLSLLASVTPTLTRKRTDEAAEDLHRIAHRRP